MIFVTVGTHEQGMDRLFKELDRLIDENLIEDEVVAQIGYSKYIPKNYKYERMISYDDMDNYIKKASLVITHGGPGSIFHPLRYEKVPIVIPRNPKFNEHVDNHQILFTKRLEKQGKLIGVYEIEDLKEKIQKYKIISEKCNAITIGNKQFIKKFSMAMEDLIRQGR